MPHTQDYTIMPTKLGIILGSATLGLTLTDIDLILAIVLKGVSIISFVIVIVINMPKFIDKIKKFFK
jgi:hypothetical protein